MDLKELAIASQGATEQGSRHAVAFKENIRERGIFERDPPRSPDLGDRRDARADPPGATDDAKEAGNPQGPAPIQGQDEVDKLYEILDKEESP